MTAGCVAISALTLLVDIPIGTASSSAGLKVCVIAARIKKHKKIKKKIKKL